MAISRVFNITKLHSKLFFLLVTTLVLTNITKAQGFQITDPTQQFPQEYTIRSVVVEGNESTRTQFILNRSTLTEGSTVVLPGDDLSNAIKRLFEVGLFSDVQIFITEQTLTNVDLLIKVVEQPRLFEYKLEGIKRSERRDLEDIITLVAGSAITEANVEQTKSTILRFFREKGFWFTSVEHSVEPSEVLDRANLIFNIDKGKRLEIKDIIFEGAEAFSNRTMLKQVRPLKEDGRLRFFSKKTFKEDDFEEGKINLISHYRKKGYIDARVVSDSVWVFDYQGDKQGIKVLFNIEEGPQYKVRNITWEGNTVYTAEQLNFSLGFEKGDVFDQEKFDANTTFNQNSTDINSLYQNIGYLFFQLIPTITKVGEDSLDIHFDLYEDEIATIREVNFTGNNQTHDDVVRRTLRVVPGNTYSREAIVRSIRELSTLGYFNPEGIVPDVLPNPQDKTVDVTFGLEENQSTSNFEFSGGYGGQSIGAIISARLNFSNFSLQRALSGDFTPFPSGDGQTLSLGVQVTGTGFQSYSFGFVEPWLNGKPTSLGVNLSYNYIYYSSTDERNQLFSTSVSLGKRLRWPDDFFSTRTIIGYQLYELTESSTTFLADGTSSLITIRQELERNSLDNFISPNSGSKLLISGEIAPPIPGFSEFYKVRTEFQHHVPISGKLVMSSTVDYGFIGYLTKNQRTNYQRFLLGGTQLQQQQSFLYDNVDLRGYPGGLNESIAPILDGEKVGGTIYTKYSMEIRYPAIANEQLQLIPYAFFDAGNSYLDFETFDPFDLKRAVGFGTRVFLPILGLVDLSYGYRLDGVPGVTNSTTLLPGEWQFLFNIGAPF
ncbi:MAG: outer membrane protein assembly factor BamA [Balneolales bacterium]|nr:outer membrane protein assembly factor BamA [Balneolales bacterium]